MGRIKKVYGEYTGNLTKKAIKQFNKLLEKDQKRAELWVYYLLEQCYLIRNRYMYGKEPHTPETRKNFKETTYSEFWLMAQTKHFGVTFEPRKEDDVFPRSKDFRKWYQFWHDYIHGLNPDTRGELLVAHEYNKDLTPYLPEKEWNEE